MKKLLGILVLGLLLSTNANAAPKSYYEGAGELVLSKEVTDLFIKYIKKQLKGRVGDLPVIFLITEDGNNAYWWTTDGNSCTRTWENEIYVVSREGISSVWFTPDVCQR